MGRGFASPAQYRGDDIKPALVSNWRALTTHLNSYVPTFNSDGTTLDLPGALNVTGALTVGTLPTIDHGTDLTGNADDDHTQYALADGTRDWVETTRLYMSSDHSVANDGVYDILYWDTELQDDGGWHSTSTNTERITVTDAGIYLVEVAVYWKDSDTTGYRMCHVKNSGTLTGIANYDDSGGRFKARQCSGVLKLAASDYLHVEARQNSSAAVNLGGGGVGSNPTWFAVTRIG